MVLLYLGAVVGANLTVAWLGASWSPLIALVFIGFDITARDSLHERWHGNRLFLRMTGLIAVGGLLTFVLNPGALRVALASLTAFLVAGAVDVLVYHGLLTRGKSRFVRINGSNVASASVDSVLFLLVAFGTVPLWIFVAQAGAKVGGGWLWSLVLTE